MNNSPRESGVHPSLVAKRVNWCKRRLKEMCMFEQARVVISSLGSAGTSPRELWTGEKTEWQTVPDKNENVPQ